MPAGRPTVSVAMCTHNGARFVREQIESILAQTVSVDQIVISDDDSHDDTLDVARKALAGANPDVDVVVLHHVPALGVTANFEAALRACTGDVILLSDQDDVWRARRVEASIEAFARGGVLLVASDAELLGVTGAPLGESLWSRLGLTATERSQLAGAEPWRPLLRRNLVTGATAAIRSSLLERSVPFPSAWLHDEWLTLMAATQGTVVLLDEKLIGYRLHDANVVGARKRTAAVKISRLVAHGTERNRRLLERARQLRDRVDTLQGVFPPEVREAAHAKAAHEQVRWELSRRRALRVGPVATLLFSGNYSRFGLGLQDAVRDLLQPLSGGRNSPDPQ